MAMASSDASLTLMATVNLVNLILSQGVWGLVQHTHITGIT